ncbi:ATP-binding protein [Streptomyces sp. 21So2-11]|uniref:ATP-binding protein n=1 Tax=Streptomyces sp. 21So2-11 TaxID=3144408 RepID=UPI00321A1C79
MNPYPFELRLLAFPIAVPQLRHALRLHVGEPCPDVQLCVSELLSNVIQHLGEGIPVTVSITRTAAHHTRVAVTDPDPRVWPVLRQAADHDESGRGLALLDAVALRWGVEQGPSSKTLWCELAGS